MASKKKQNVKQIMKTNQQIDPIQYGEAEVLLKELRRGGASGPEYDLVSPFDRRYQAAHHAKRQAELVRDRHTT